MPATRDHRVPPIVLRHDGDPSRGLSAYNHSPAPRPWVMFRARQIHPHEPATDLQEDGLSIAALTVADVPKAPATAIWPIFQVVGADRAHPGPNDVGVTMFRMWRLLFSATHVPVARRSEHRPRDAGKRARARGC
jgi:hypothetical protein